MPLYPYRCSACEHSFEQLSSGSSAVATAVACPECGSEKVGRTFALPARPKAVDAPATNCRRDGPPCGATGCGRSVR